MKKFIYLSALSAAFALTACDSFLEEEVKGKITQTSYYATVDDIETIMPTIFYDNSDYYYDGRGYNMAFRSDDLTSGGNGDAAHLESFDQPNSEQYVGVLWKQCYLTIKNCNMVHDLIKENEISGDKQYLSQLQGIAYFFRGFNYMNLGRYFKQAPLVLNYKVNFDMPSASQNRVLEQAVADFEMAEKLLPDMWPTSNRMYKEAPFKLTAKCALAEIYLFMAGYPYGGGTAYYQKAAAKAKEVIDGAAALGRGFDTYDNMWNEKYPTENENKERLYSVYFTDYSQKQRVAQCHMPDYYGGWGWISAERNFYRTFPDGPRKQATFWDIVEISEENQQNLGVPAELPWDDALIQKLIPYAQPLYRKIAMNPENAGKRKCDISMGKRCALFMPLRYTHAATCYAEAIARATGSPDNLAYELMDAIRDRAELPHYDRGLSGAEFAKLVVQERAWEFAGEWTRFHDLCRLEMLEEAFTHRATDEYVPNSSLGTPNHNNYFLPVPSTDSSSFPMLLEVDDSYYD